MADGVVEAVRADHLERDLAADLAVAGVVDDAHAPLADRRDQVVVADAVLAEDGPDDHGIGRGTARGIRPPSGRRRASAAARARASAARRAARPPRRGDGAGRPGTILDPGLRRRRARRPRSDRRRCRRGFPLPRDRRGHRRTGRRRRSRRGPFPQGADQVELAVDPGQRPAELVGDLLVRVQPHLEQGDLAQGVVAQDVEQPCGTPRSSWRRTPGRARGRRSRRTPARPRRGGPGRSDSRSDLHAPAALQGPLATPGVDRPSAGSAS